MKSISFLTAFLFPYFLFGQTLNFQKVNKPDSIELTLTWKALLHSIKFQDRKKFKSLSLDKIVCSRCSYWDKRDIYADNATEAKLPVDSFITEAFTTFKKDGFWGTLETHTYSLSRHKVSDQLIYRFAFDFKPDDTMEGYTHFITFIKVGNSFKFYGLDTIP